MKLFCVYLCDFKDRNDYFLSLMPYGIISIAAYLEKNGHDVTLANLSSYGYFKGVDLTLQTAPDAVLISIFSFNRTESFKYITELKNKNKKIIIIAGGQHPTFLSEKIILKYPEIDFIIKGEGEYSVNKLITESLLNTEKIITSERIADINSIPYASLFSGKTIGVNPNEQFKYIITSRGCASACTYCSSPNFWMKKVTYRSPENIISELKHINKEFGIIYFSIRDDNFTLNKKRVMKFCKLLDESGLYMMWNCQARVDTIDEEMLIAMKKSGLEHLQFGVESGSEKILKAYDKNITIDKVKNAAYITRKVGVYLSFYLMCGMNGETENDITKTINLMSDTLPHDVIVSPVAYYPGTGIYSDSIKSGKINDNIWFDSVKNGLYLNDDSINNKYINTLLSHSNKISAKSRYSEKDFKLHKLTVNDNCWITDIIEGDYYSDEHNFDHAYSCYNKIITRHPENIWGYLRMAELISECSPQNAINLFLKASEIVPSYYGSWLRIAQMHLLRGNFSKAENSIKQAIKFNSFDKDVKKTSLKIKQLCSHK